MSIKNQSVWVILFLIVSTLLFSGIVASFWISGQKHRFENRRQQLLLEFNKISGFDRQRLEDLALGTLDPALEKKRVQELQAMSTTPNIISWGNQRDQIILDLETAVQSDFFIRKRRQTFVQELRTKVLDFNQLIQSHYLIQYFDLEPIEVPEL